MLPGRPEIAAGTPIHFTFDVPGIIAAEKSALAQALSDGNLALLVNRYPIRETPALDRIVENLGFQGRTQYEGAVLQLLADDVHALQFARELFGELADEMGVPPIVLPVATTPALGT